MGRAFIGLGANQGQPDATFLLAAGALASVGRVVRVSSLYASAPRDMTDQPDFTNAVLELETDLEPADLLLALKRLELSLGRDPQRFGPRLIDLDILVMEGRCVSDPELGLIIPHPRLAERRFALEPLAELDSQVRPWETCGDDRATLTVSDLLPAVADQEVSRLAGPEWLDQVAGRDQPTAQS